MRRHREGNNFGRTVTSYGQFFDEKRSTTKLLVIDDNLAMVTAPPKSSHQALFCLLFCGPGRSPLLLGPFFVSFVFGPTFCCCVAAAVDAAAAVAALAGVSTRLGGGTTAGCDCCQDGALRLGHGRASVSCGRRVVSRNESHLSRTVGLQAVETSLNANEAKASPAIGPIGRSEWRLLRGFAFLLL